MKILYDHQVFSTQTHGGISRYFSELMKQFSLAGEPNYELALGYSNNEYLNSWSLGHYKTFLKGRNFRGKQELLYALNKVKSKKAISRGDFDIFHPTYYHPYFLKYIGGKPFVLTIYDMIHEIFAQDFPPTDKTSKFKNLLAQKAAKIIAVSENTKNDAVRLLGIDEEKVTVIYLGNSLPKFPANQSFELPVPDRYILFVGNRNGYKNFEIFIKATRPLLFEYKDLSVVCAGGGNFTNYEKHLFKKLRLEKKIYRFEGGDEVLAFLYQKAIAFVFPSLYEGFGIPVLEAFGCGCPVVLSNTNALVEIGREAAVYFDPKNEVSIREAVCSVISNEETRRNLITRGFKRMRKFSWSEAAHHTATVYKSIV